MTDLNKKLKIYGMVDVLFAIIYLIIFIVLLPAHDTLAKVFTVGFPVILLGCGTAMIFNVKYSREIGLGIASLFIMICLFSIALLMYTIGYFKGIYGPIGQGITIVSWLAIALVIEMFGIWPFFQLKALWRHPESTGEKQS
ncbi:hypothetical protein KKF34_15810 [Myxococcota bacterium]|nr:hypothetical protein [Myxococcota bacterium]MBU1379585.1 hypothetical protein [Myxococcota bacterium]MBU1498342.1 hypothetical protein [Myxococcota bacterium]